MKLSDFDYALPIERIAQTPLEPRDSSRLMVIHRQNGEIEHRTFRDVVDYLRAGDVLVMNQTRVIPARLHGVKDTGGAVEVLLLNRLDDTRWLSLVGGKRMKVGTKLTIKRGDLTIAAVIEEERAEAERVVCFSEPLENHLLEQIGETPLPPYITTPLADPERYQTVYSHTEGSAAAPTAGLHFTPDLLIGLQRAGIKLAYCTLHIGLDTFAPVKEEIIEQHKIHRERAILTPDDARIINEAKLGGGRIIAVGTTSSRTLETAAIRSAAFGHAGNDPHSLARTLHSIGDNVCGWRPVMAVDEDTDLYITPGYRFRAVDVLLTNFHLPKSTLLMMISAFWEREKVLDAYKLAVAMDYRFFSLGDAMLLL